MPKTLIQLHYPVDFTTFLRKLLKTTRKTKEKKLCLIIIILYFKLNTETQEECLQFPAFKIIPINIYLFKVNYGYIRTMCGTCFKFIIKKQEQLQ